MLHLIERISEQCARPATRLKHPAQELHQTLHKVMRGFGRQCRGQGKVLVTLVRQTEQHLLDLGGGIATWSQEAKALLHQDTHLREAQRQRLLRDLEAASDAHRQIAQQSQRLTQGKKLGQCKIVKAYDPTIAPIIKGKSNCPAQFGRKIGLLSEPASGFIFAHRVPKGNPSDPSYVLPMLDKVQQAIDLVTSPKHLQIHSLGGDLGVNDAELRHALHARGILTVGIPTTVEPIKQVPSPEDVRDILNGSGLHRIRTPHQVHLACASGYSRPVVESHIATLMSRGADHVRYKGLEGAVVQIGMTIIAHNGAVLVRICQQRLSQRGQKFRRLLGLKRHNINKISNSQN
jgi:Transposase DDE domain